jgi:hypothetical protein
MQLLTESLWLGVGFWVLLYVSDYAFTIACARMYRAGVRETITFEGSYELTPFFQKDIDRLRTFSPRFVAALLWGVSMLTLLWWLTRGIWPEAFQLSVGALVLPELAIHVRHIRNFVLFRQTLGGQGVRGHIEYSRFLSLRLSAFEILAFAGLFLVGFLGTWSYFLLGGAITCLSMAGGQLRLARKHAASIERAAQAIGPDGRAHG